MDTIAAISTGNTLSAIGILRVSGEGSFAICGKVFRAANGRPLEEPRFRGFLLCSYHGRNYGGQSSAAPLLLLRMPLQ